jgi:hypothetical protein
METGKLDYVMENESSSEDEQSGKSSSGNLAPSLSKLIFLASDD